MGEVAAGRERGGGRQLPARLKPPGPLYVRLPILGNVVMPFVSRLFALIASLVPWAAVAQSEPPANLGAELKLVDQFQQTHQIADHVGEVVIIVFGDRHATKDCRKLGEGLHVLFHPAAADLPEDEGHLAPVRPLRGATADNPGPNVRVIPVACTGLVPKPVRSVLQKQFAKGSPHVPVWLDFDNALRSTFGLKEREPNVAIFDCRGRFRKLATGPFTEAAVGELAQEIEGLRREAAK